MNPRLVMNHLQYEFGLIPSKIVKENKGLWTIFISEKNMLTLPRIEL